MGRAVVLAGLLAAVALSAGAAAGARTGNELKAFDRPARPSDRIPTGVAIFRDGRYGSPVASRLVATYDGGPTRRSRLFLVKTSKGMTCELFLWHGAGGGCSQGSLLAGHKVTAGASQFLAGVTANDVTRVVVIAPGGVHHRVPLSSDKGFIYDCRASDGCRCALMWLDAYVGTRRVAHQDWLGKGCSRKRG